ncbi:hypothetical protein P3G22_10110, partial [Rhodopseudomonas sp. BAL398]|nr:hypothetical protein [Rhodopseudomonas sp. BAL398]
RAPPSLTPLFWCGGLFCYKHPPPGWGGVARVRRAGKSVGIADVDVFNEKGVLLAIGRGTYSTLES